MKVCKNFIEKPEATTCQNCGCEKWEHENPILYGGKGILEYIKNMPPNRTMTNEEFFNTYFDEHAKKYNLHQYIPVGKKAMELFDQALREELDKIIDIKMQEEEFNKELRENGFLAFKEFFITTENGKK